MKKLLLLGLILTGCGSDKDSGESSSSALAFPAEMQGKWTTNLNECTARYVVEISGADIQTNYLATASECGFNFHVRVWERELLASDGDNYDMKTNVATFTLNTGDGVDLFNETAAFGRTDWEFEKEISVLGSEQEGNEELTAVMKMEDGALLISLNFINHERSASEFLERLLKVATP